jgi:hypothetical protein
VCTISTSNSTSPTITVGAVGPDVVVGVAAKGLGAGLGVSGTRAGIASGVGSGVEVRVATGSEVTLDVGSGADVRVAAGSEVTFGSGAGLGDTEGALDSSVWHSKPTPSIASKANESHDARSSLM